MLPGGGCGVHILGKRQVHVAFQVLRGHGTVALSGQMMAVALVSSEVAFTYH